MDKRQLNILVIDDSTEIRWLVRYALEAEGHKVKEAKDGLEGLESVRQAVPDLIILDVQMPIMSGSEFVREIKKAPDTAGASVPVIVMSASPVNDPYLRSNSQHVLQKPIDLDSLFELIEKFAP